MAVARSVGDSLVTVSPTKRPTKNKEDVRTLPPPLQAPALCAEGATVKAAKPDDAEANMKDWNNKLLREIPIWKLLGDEGLARVCNGLRSKVVSFWRINLRREASEF
jgi:hypothetical protein